MAEARAAGAAIGANPVSWLIPCHRAIAKDRRLTGYHHATPDTLQRRFLSTTGEILNRGNEIIVRLDRRTYSPILRQADLPTTEVPWWSGRRLSYEYR